jgi:hypothetical protein
MMHKSIFWQACFEMCPGHYAIVIDTGFCLKGAIGGFYDLAQDA